MTETVGLIAVAASMIGILAFMFRRLASPAGTVRGIFAGYGSTNTLSGFGGGLLASVAASTTLSSTSAGSGSAASVGAALGVAYFVLTGLHLDLGTRVVSGIVGTAGFVALVIFLVAGTGCAMVPLWQRLLILALIMSCGAAGVIGSLLLARPRLPSTLALFGALKIAVFLAAPLGVSLPTLPFASWVLSVVTAALLGAASAMAPQFIIGLAAAMIGVASIGVSTVVGDTCSAGPDYADLAALVGFTTVYLLLKAVLGRWVRP